MTRKAFCKKRVVDIKGNTEYITKDRKKKEMTMNHNIKQVTGVSPNIHTTNKSLNWINI